ncbi:MAG: MauE/DoxX family redox-associated membrane protein [Nocardioides sp.]|jgi:hypothetical protein
MPHAVILAPLILIAVLVFSAMAKWNASDSTRSALRLLRVPEALQAAAVARSVPPGELLIAAALFLPAGWPARLGALAATGLMLIYWGLIARGLTFDPRPTCGCFGRIGQNQVTERTLVRNTLLVAVAVVWTVATWQGDSLPALLGDLGSTGWWWVVGALTVSALTYLITAPPRPKRASAAAHPPQAAAEPSPVDDELDYIRERIPEAALQRTDGTMATLYELASSQAVLLVSINCFCGSSHRMAESLADWRERLPSLKVALLTTNSIEVTRHSLPLLQDDDDMLYDHASLVWRALKLPASPAAVLLGADGMLAGGPVHGVEEIEAFITDIEEVLNQAAEEDDVVAGEVVASTDAEVGQPN